MVFVKNPKNTLLEFKKNLAFKINLICKNKPWLLTGTKFCKFKNGVIVNPYTETEVTPERIPDHLTAM